MTGIWHDSYGKKVLYSDFGHTTSNTSTMSMLSSVALHVLTSSKWKAVNGLVSHSTLCMQELKRKFVLLFS